VVGKERRHRRHVQHGGEALAGNTRAPHNLRHRHAAKSSRWCTGPAQQIEACGECLGRIEFCCRQHRPQAVEKLDRERATARRAARVGDRLVVAAVDLDGQSEHLTGDDVAMEPRLVGERRDRAAAKIDLCHGDPCCELPDGLGDEAGWKRRQRRRHSVLPARANSGRKPCDPVDERERGEMVSHGGSREATGLAGRFGRSLR
jgi:hypothetical protein